MGSAGVGGADAAQAGQGATAAHGTSPAGAADPVAELSRAVASGELSPEQAVERLIDRAVEGASAHLSAAERAELTSVLRAALEGDPVLRSVLEPG